MLLPVLLLSTLASAPGGPAAADPASFHPASAELFVAVDDVRAAGHAIAGAPLLQTLRDEHVRAFIEKLSGEPDFDLDAKLLEAWQQMVPPAGRDVLAKVTSGSLSASFAGEHPSLEVVLDLQDADAARAAFDLALSQLPGAKALPDAPVPDAHGFSGPVPADLGMWAAPVGTHVVIATGDLLGAETLSRLSGADSGLAGADAYVAARKELPSTPGTPILRAFTACSLLRMVKELQPTVEGEVPFDLSAILPPGNDRPSTLRMVLTDGGRYVTDGFTAGEDVAAKPAVDPAWAGLLTAHPLIGYTGSFDPAKVGKELRSGLALLESQTGSTGALDGLEKALGFPVDRIFSHLGSHFAIDVEPIGGLGLPGTDVWVELSDAEGFQKDLDALAAKLPEAFPGITVKSRDYKVKNAAGERVPYPITTLSLPPEIGAIGGMISIDPTMTVAGGKLLVSVSSTHVKRELKRLYGAKGDGETADTDPWKTGGFQLPEAARSAHFMDWGAQIEGLVAMAKTVGPMFAGNSGFDFDSIPAGETFTRLVHPSFGYVLPAEGGALFHHEASFGPETWLMPVVGILSARVEQSVTMPVPAPTDHAQAAGGPDQEASLATQVALQEVRTGLRVYQLDKGSYPDALADLMTATERFPEGYVPGGKMPNDGWGHPLSYAREGDTYRLWSIGPDGVDQNGAGDDVQLQ